MMLTKLDAQLEAGAYTDEGNINWGSGFRALDQETKPGVW